MSTVQTPAACNRCGNCHVGVLIYAPHGLMVLIVSEVESALSYQEDLVYEDALVPIDGPRMLTISQRDFREFVFV